MSEFPLNIPLTSLGAIGVILVVYFFLITEKINKVIVTGLGATALILLHIFRTADHSPQEIGFEFVSRNLDVLGFIIGMMILIGIIRESGVFEAIAIWLVKLVKGNPKWLLFSIGLLTLVLTILFSNIPTVLILTPILLVLIRELKLPHFPFFFVMITMANIGGATTPISDPTTYYQAKTVGLGFLEVIENSGIIVLALFLVVSLYSQFIFRKTLSGVTVDKELVKNFNPKAAIKNKKILYVGVPILIMTILLVVFKDIFKNYGIHLDNATLLLTAAFLCMQLLDFSPKRIFQEIIDWEIIFFFMGLFVIIGSLEFTGMIGALGRGMVAITHGNLPLLLFLVTVGSGILSMFIDNVPYNITMVGAILAMKATGIDVYPLWWGLNLGTSFGGAGSPIGAACNVVALGQADKDGFHTKFAKYLSVGFPLVVINGLVAFAILWFRYL